MNDDRSLERAARSWLEEGPTRAPDRPVEAALSRIQTTPQERDLVPWRLPNMTPLTRFATVAVLGAAAIGGSLFLLGRGPNVGVDPTPSPGSSAAATAPATAAPDVTPDPSVMAAFRTARDRICTEAVAETEPLKERLVNVFDGSISQAQRDDWVAALEALAAVQGNAIDRIAELTPPAAIAAANADNITIFRDMNARVLLIATHLRAEDDAAALEVDTSTNQLGALIVGFEVRNGLVSCP